MIIPSSHLPTVPTYYNEDCWISDWHTAIPYRASTGPEQGFHCVVFPHPVMKTGFPCEKNYTGKTLFSLQGWVCSAVKLKEEKNDCILF
jgi:hypothetical protein